MGLMEMLEEALNGLDATATPATHKPEIGRTVATVATVAVASAQKGETDSPSMTLSYSREKELQAALTAERMMLFEGKGIATQEAQALANRLSERDRQQDDRRSCAECKHWYAGRCKIARYPIGESTIQTLHRCKGLTV